ncbi:MAG: recombinase family protein [Oscillospiraceae bacterium]|nr:recombinase family protein [Oscillospiraceae bacterium]
MPHLIYLRKSRADTEAETRGEGETLARHEKALLDLAARLRLAVGGIYREIVSGDSIASRPWMQRLLSEVGDGKWEGVLVMEIERLARGDSIDQGIVMQAFKYSGTKVVTPLKVYDPNDEFDEQYFEFGLFMSRQEYKTIARRMQRGREAAVREGKYVSNMAPYGYRRVRLPDQRGWTLEPVEEQADVVRMMFDLYVSGERCPGGTPRRLGYEALARKLNSMGIPPARGDYWRSSSVREILINPTYIGKIRWGRRPETRKIENGEKVTARASRGGNCLTVDGLHPAVVGVEAFSRAQEIMAANRMPPVRYTRELANPLAGLIVCGKCGRKMRFTRSPPPRTSAYLACPVRACPNVCSSYAAVEERLLASLRGWLSGYRIQLRQGAQGPPDPSRAEVLRRALKQSEAGLAALAKQTSSLHDLLERGVYSAETFLSRSRELAARVSEEEARRGAMEAEIALAASREQARASIVPKAERLLSVYDDLPTPAAKNILLKELIEKAVYTKEPENRRSDAFELTLYPRLPSAGP